MKTIILLVAVMVLGAAAALAQDAKGGQALTDLQTTRKAKEEKKAQVSPPKPTNQILGKPVVYGGFFTDFFRADRKRALLSLRTPIDPEKDLENLWFDPGTNRVRGTILFSIKF